MQPGERYALGEHRLSCGDAAQRSLIEALLDGAPVDLVLTDPPYGVGYVADDRPGARRRGFDGLANDDLDADAFARWLGGVLRTLDPPPGVPVYLFHADTMGEAARRAFREAGLHLAACLVWAKTAAVLSRGDYHFQHEPILYGWRQGAAHRWYGDRRQSTL